MTAQALLKKAAARLEEAGVPDAGWDAAALLEAAGGPDRTYYPLVKCDPMPEETVGRFEAMLSRRLSREPLQQIIGEAWFYGRLSGSAPRCSARAAIRRSLRKPFYGAWRTGKNHCACWTFVRAAGASGSRWRRSFPPRRSG